MSISRRAFLRATLLSLVAWQLNFSHTRMASSMSVWRAFTSDSIWNTDCSTAPVDPLSGSILSYLNGDNSGGYVKIINTESGTSKGAAIYWPTVSEKQYTIYKASGGTYSEQVRIPKGATSGSGSDG